MTVRSYSRRRASLALAPIAKLDSVRDEPPPPSGALINVILEYADLQHDAGGGRFVLSLSQRRMKDPVFRSLLGRETKRLRDVSIVWDEAEGEIVRVHDAAVRAPAPFAPADDVSELDSFELTEAALAYIAAHAKRA
jgi:hypothetical protein